jgi:3-hydroxybutyryl-CoA dehydrogenase
MTAVQTIGVIGAGTMGSGIAQVCAVVGLSVTMIDIDEAAVARGRNAVSSSLDRLVRKEKLSAADKESALKRIDGTTNYDVLRNCDLVIEAATENEALKVKILKQIDELAKVEAVVASNT